MAAQILPPPLQVVGKVNGKHGYQGSVQLQYLPASNLGHIKKGNYLFVLINGKGVPFLIQEVSKNKDVVKLKFIDSEEQAKAIIGCEIAISASISAEKSSKQKNIGSINHLIGFQILVPAENFAGEIIDIVEYPQGLMMEIKPNSAFPTTDSKKSKTVLIPLVEEWIEEIQEKEKSFTLTVPEGLLQINM